MCISIFMRCIKTKRVGVREGFVNSVNSLCKFPVISNYCQMSLAFFLDHSDGQPSSLSMAVTLNAF